MSKLKSYNADDLTRGEVDDTITDIQKCLKTGRYAGLGNRLLKRFNKVYITGYVRGADGAGAI